MLPPESHNGVVAVPLGSVNGKESRAGAAHAADEWSRSYQGLEGGPDRRDPPEDQRFEVVARHPANVSPARKDIEIEGQRAAPIIRLSGGVNPPIGCGRVDRDRR